MQQKYKIEIDLFKICKHIFNFIFSKKVFIPLILVFALFKGYQIYLYIHHQTNAEKAILKIDDIRRLCADNKNVEKINRHYFFQQQVLAAHAVGEFEVADYHIFGMPFFGRKFEDKDDILYHKMMNQSYEHCPELLKTKFSDLQDQLEDMGDDMVHRIRLFN